MPEISVIVPAYNAGKTILETIQSILQQSFQDFELIVINDGSTDNTLEVLKQVEDQRLKVISYKNAGLPTARNRGISISIGKFLSFIDADDLWTPDKLQLQLVALQSKPNTGAVYSWTANMRDDGQTVAFVQGCSSLVEGNIYPELLLGNFIGSGSNILVRREVIESVGCFEPTLKSFEDWDFYLRVAAKWDFAVVPRNQILYRKTSGSMSSKVEVMEREGLCALDRAYKIAPPELQFLKQKSLAFLYRFLADLYLTNSLTRNEIELAWEKLSVAIKLYPKILLEKYVQILLIKLLLKRFLPQKLANSITQVLKKPLILKDPRA